MTNVPRRYVPKYLIKKDKRQQAKELRRSRRAYKKGKYYTRRKVKSFKSKVSPHIVKARKMYKINKISPSRNLASKTKCKLKGLKKMFQKGQGAYFSSGSRPNQTGHSWGYARLASAITGGKAAAVDYKILLENCSKNSRALRLAKRARTKYNKGRRRVKQVKIGGKKRIIYKSKATKKNNTKYIKKRKSKKNYKYPFARGHLFYLNRKSRGKRITAKIIRRYPKAFNAKLRKRFLVMFNNNSNGATVSKGGRRRRKTNKMKETIVEFKRGPFPKKYTAFVKNKKTKKVRRIHFGDRRYQQYKDRTKLGLYKHKNHGTRKRMQNYFNRHSGTKKRGKAIKKEKRLSKGHYTAKILSHKYLW